MSDQPAGLAGPHSPVRDRAERRLVVLRTESEVVALEDEIGRVVRRRTVGPSSPAVASVLGRLRSTADLDLDVPTASKIPGMRGVKSGVKRLVGFYVTYLGQQVGDFGRATTQFAQVAAAELGRLEDDLDDVRTELADLSSALRRSESEAQG